MSVLSAISNLIVSFANEAGYWGFFILMVLESTAIPIILPAELVLISTGYLIGIGKFKFFYCIVISVIGCLIGSSINYSIAFFFGRSIIEKYGKYIFINKKRFERFEAVFSEHASLLTFVGRFLPLIKHISSIPPGLSHMNILKFSFYTCLGSGLFSSIMLVIGIKIGENANNIDVIKPYIEIGGIAFVAVVSLAYYLYNKSASKAITKQQK